MATIPYVPIEYNGRSGKHFQWTLGDDSVGQPVTLVSDQVELSVAVSGAYGGASLAMQGQIGVSGYLDIHDSYGVTLTQLSGTELRPIGPGIDSFQPSTSGGTSTVLVVTLRVFEKVRP